MKRIILLITIIGWTIHSALSIEIKRMEPTYWWVGMQNPELQLMIYGENISGSEVSIDYPGIKLKEVVNVENPNFLFLYLNISKETAPGTLNIIFRKGKETQVKTFELKERNRKAGAAGFSPADVMYLITPDRFANADPSNDNLDDVKVDRSNPNARHGGDLRGIINKLDYIRDLGFTTIWLNPVLENKMPGGSYHGYAITDFYQVDPRFGSNEEYIELVDLPCSDWLNNQSQFMQTTHYKWTLMDIHAPQSEKDRLVKGWFSRGMPDLNQQNRHLARYLIQNSIWWIEYARIDGIRQDTHPYADYDFMAEWCQEVEKEYPNFNIVGEAWYPKGSASAWWQQGSALNHADSHLKTVMDFDLTFTSQKAFNENCSSNEGSESGLFKIYEVIAQDFLFPNPNNILIFLDNHDISRFMQKDENDLRRYKQAIAFLLTTRGIPQIYYGTEILMYGNKSEGDGNIRKDFPGGWAGDPVDAFTSSGRTDLQNQAWDYLKRLLNWRKQSEAVTTGQLIHYTPDESGCYVYARVKGNQTVLVVMNGTNEDRMLDMNRFHEVIQGKQVGKDVISGKTIDITNAMNIAARGVYILEL